MTNANWSAVALGVYLLGLVILLTRLWLGMRGSRRLTNSADHICARYFPRKDEVEDGHTSAALDFLSSRSHIVGLKHPPRLKESAALSVPATVGIRRPVILLPEDWRAWTQEKLEAVLAHEISHVARRDALTQLLSLLHRAVFWFSPLAWWLDHQLTELAEQASDEAALAGGADRTLYAETLLGFFAQLDSVPGRVRWQALSMASRTGPGRAERRVDQILAWQGATAMKKPIAMGLIGLAVAIVFVAASLRPFIPAAQAEEKAGAKPAARPADSTRARMAPTQPVVRVQDDAPSRHHLVAAQVAPAPSNHESKAQQEQTPSPDVNTMTIHGSYGGNSGPRYVIIHGNSREVDMSGDEEDVQHARRLSEKIKGDFIWFERDEKSYVITDPAFLSQVKALFAPEEELGKKQDALGQQQDELGRQQDALGEQMEKVSLKVPDITPDLERIRARLKELQTTGATQSQLGHVQSQLGELQSQVGRLQSEAGRQQSVIGKQQSDLGRKQAALGRQQAELGRQQAEIARKATGELRQMFDDAITKGIAKPE
jgi:hypothetical protein